MTRQGAFDCILASLHKAMLDDSHWPATTALIDDACGVGTSGSVLIVGEGEEGPARLWFARAYSHGHRRQDLEREYFENYYLHDERVPRIRNLPDSRLVHIPSLYTEQELRTSLVYNEGLHRTGCQNGLNVRLDGPHGSRIVWGISNPASTSGWGSPQLEFIENLLPHIRQFVHVRQALADANALGASHTELLDANRFGVMYLDATGRIVEANDTARDILHRGSGLSDRGGFLGVWLPAENLRFQRLLAAALRPFGAPAAGGTMTVTHNAGKPRLVVHLIPLRDPHLDFWLPRIAALLLVVDPTIQLEIDPKLVASAFGLAPAESRVAAWLGEGRTVRDIAESTGRQENAVRKVLKRSYKKLGVSRQTDLVRLVLTLARHSGRRT